MTTENNQQRKKLIKFDASVAGYVLAMFVVMGLLLIMEYAQKERQRDLQSWQSRLSLMAEIKASEIDSVLQKRKAQMKMLTENSSLRLFLSQFSGNKTADTTIVKAQYAHVRNLLYASADRFGLNEHIREDKNINLNVSSSYGMLIIDASLNVIMSTKGLSSVVEQQKKGVQKVFETGDMEFIDFYKTEAQRQAYGFIYPVLKIQDKKNQKPVGVVIMLLDPQRELYKVLEKTHSSMISAESFLVRVSGSAMVYVSPLKGSEEIFHQLADNRDFLASSFAFHSPGDFKQSIDYKGKDVLVTGRKIKNSPWALIQKIDMSEAMSESDKHQKYLFSVFILALLFITAGFIAVWKHSSNSKLEKISETLKVRTGLLDAVTSNMKEYVLLLEKNSRIDFINPQFAEILGVEAENVKTVPAGNILGKQVLEQLMSMVSGDEKKEIMSLEMNGKLREYHVTTAEITSGEFKTAHLFVLHDISELRAEQVSREQLAEGIISTLVKAVDKHDPYCANHSQRTRQVVSEIAKTMGYEQKSREVVEMAALLANVGKLYVPKEVLIKMDVLTEKETDVLKQHIDYTENILSELKFDGPVLDIIKQKNEHLDGSGYPQGLVAEQIMAEAKILAVANTFVAMVSSRAYRPGRKLKEVLNILLAETEIKYDRQVVAALFHIAENKADWRSWEDVEEV